MATNGAVLALVFSYGLEPSAPIWKQLFFQVHATLRPGVEIQGDKKKANTIIKYLNITLSLHDAYVYLQKC